MELFRLTRVVAQSLLRPPLAPLEASRVALRVWPADLDLNLHMNNGRYLSLMDLGRFDLLGRMGLVREALRRKWRPMVGSATVRFRRSLEPLQRYELVSRVVCWDEKWLFMEQNFEREGKILASGLVKGLLRAPTGNVPSRELFRLAGHDLESPPIPEGIALWQQAEERLAAARPRSA